MGLLEKIGKKTKIGLAVLVTGALLSGVAYAKEINNEGWPLPDKTKYYQSGEPTIKECQYKHEGKTINIEIKTECYANIPDSKDMREIKIYKTLSFEDQVFMYVMLESDGSDAYDLTILVDRDGNGSMETKYTDAEELEQDGIPEWVIDRAEKS